MALIRNAYLWQCPICKKVKVTTTKLDFLQMLVSKCPMCKTKWVLKG
jgi:hypothetical protein